MALSPPGAASARSGYTLVEMLVVLALAGLVATWYLSVRPRQLDGAVVALRAQVVQARFEAIERNSPVALIYAPAEGAFLTLAGAAASAAEVCEWGREVTRLELGEFPGVRVSEAPANGIVWLPSGSGRTCSGSGVFNQTILLTEGRLEGRIVISRAGRVRSEVDL